MPFTKYGVQYQQPAPATDAEIRACEKRHEIKLPATLIALLKIQNGGDIDSEGIEEPLFSDLLGVREKSEPMSPLWEQQIASLQDWLVYQGKLEDYSDSFPAIEEFAGDIYFI